MSMIYFPSCKFTAKHPIISGKIVHYLKEKCAAQAVGCCRTDLNKITDNDTVIYICNTCAAFAVESTQAQNVVSLWELMLEDNSFVYPDHSGKVITLQDCWRVYDNLAQQEAVRAILRKMNITVIEQQDHHDKTKFCGYSLYEPMPADYHQLAPKRLVKDAQGMFVAHSTEDKERLMKEHCSSITTKDVVCYCMGCSRGIELGGKHAVHLAELVFAS